jgi:hypothetical protein
LILLALSADATAIGSEDFRARETATFRLKQAGMLAVPALHGAARSASPEARRRAHSMLAPYRSAVLDQRAVAALLGPWPPAADEFYRDDELRVRVARLAAHYGCHSWDVGPIDPASDAPDPWWFWSGVRPADKPHLALLACRRLLGSGGWLGR